MKKNTRFLVSGILGGVSIVGGIFAYYRFFQENSVVSTVTSAKLETLDTQSNTACSETQKYDKVLCLIEGLKSTLSPELLAEIQLDYSLQDAQKWSNFPPAGYKERIGPTLSQFNEEQKILIKALLQEVTGKESNEGYDEIEQILNADDFLQNNATGRDGGFSSGNYHIAFLGTPSKKGTWQLYFGGHHLAVSNTYTNGILVSGTPSFRGVEPFETFTQNGRENIGLQQEQKTFADVLASLSESEIQKATLGKVYTNIIVGPQQDGLFPTVSEGLLVSELSEEKKKLLLQAIFTYIGDISETESAELLKKYSSELDTTYIGFRGSKTLSEENDYIRIDGPSLWIEISMQGGRSWEGIHPHSVWRDKTNDYGGEK